MIWDANPERVRILNPYYMEVTAAKLLNLPMKQPRKVKQVRGGDGRVPCTPPKGWRPPSWSPWPSPCSLLQAPGSLHIISFPLSLQKPTTGLLAITLALHFCDLVHIAGFGYPDSANKKQTIHYYEQITLKSMAVSIYPHFLSMLPLIFPPGMGDRSPAGQHPAPFGDAEWGGRLSLPPWVWRVPLRVVTVQLLPWPSVPGVRVELDLGYA